MHIRDFITYFSCDFQDLWKMNKDIKASNKNDENLHLFAIFKLFCQKLFCYNFLCIRTRQKTVLSMLIIVTQKVK